MTAEQPGDGNGPAEAKLVKVVHEDFTGDTEQEHFERQIVKRRWA